jgi:hypothetical protein
LELNYLLLGLEQKGGKLTYNGKEQKGGILTWVLQYGGGDEEGTSHAFFL